MEIKYSESWTIGDSSFDLSAKMISEKDCPLSINPCVVLYGRTSGSKVIELVTNLSSLVVLVEELKSIQASHKSKISS